MYYIDLIIHSIRKILSVVTQIQNGAASEQLTTAGNIIRQQPIKTKTGDVYILRKP